MERSALDALLADMSLQEKIEQLVQLNGDFYGGADMLTGPAAQFKLTKEQPYRTGSVLSEHGAEKLRKLQDDFMAEQPHHIPALFMADVIHGYRTIFPAPIAQGCSFDPELTREISEAAAKEASAAGVHVTFAPMADLVRDSRWGRCMESTGEDPYLNSLYAAAAVKGFQGDNCGEKGKVAACVKHFAAYGAVQSGRDYNVTELSERTLRQDYLPAYKAAIDAGAELVMTAFNTVDRIPCTLNKKLMNGILRGEFGFDGVLISDYNAIGEAMVFGAAEDKRDAAKKAIECGCDIDMVSDCYINNLADLVKSGEISEEIIDKAVMRVLELKNKLGLFENPYKDGSVESEKAVIYCNEHLALSRRAAVECSVLLKNKGALPLKKGGKVVVAGALCDSRDITGSWAIFAEKDKTVTLRQALTELYGGENIEFYPADTAGEKLLSAAAQADTVILALGEHEMMTGESRSRAEIYLPEEQRKLFADIAAVNKNTAVVLFGGRPLAIPELAENAAAILAVWLPGTHGAYAVADMLYGAENPSGKLSMSIPYCAGQLPISYAAFNTGRPYPDGAKGFIPFLSNYMDVPNKPLYSFGEGLSYTEFEYSPVELDSNILTCGGKITASVTVKNTGKMRGAEAVQMYIRDIKGSVVRPLRELKGVEKIRLEAGESRRVSFEISCDMLKFYDENMGYVCENGAFTVYIGGSSLTENSADFTLEGI